MPFDKQKYLGKFKILEERYKHTNISDMLILDPTDESGGEISTALGIYQKEHEEECMFLGIEAISGMETKSTYWMSDCVVILNHKSSAPRAFEYVIRPTLQIINSDETKRKEGLKLLEEILK